MDVEATVHSSKAAESIDNPSALAAELKQETATYLLPVVKLFSFTFVVQVLSVTGHGNNLP